MEASDSRRVGLREETRRFSAETSQVRQCSAEFSKPSTSAVIVVKKSMKEPEPPRRSVSLLTPQRAKPVCKRYSCPTLGIPAPSSSPSPSTSTLAPLIQTSAITGPDPLGWKVRHKPGNPAPRCHAGRLSLQIPLSDIFPEKRSQHSSNSKPLRRHNSESSAFLGSSGRSLSVMIEELGKNVSEPDDVFEEKVKENIKEPPPVPIKSEMARQVAQLIAFSRELSLETEPKPTEVSDTKL